MYLYHYSTREYKELKTLFAQRPIAKKEKDDGDLDINLKLYPGPYYNHISFFFEEAPIDILGSIFPKDHSVWFTGNRLYEHIVNIRDLNDPAFMAVQTPAQVKFYDKVKGPDLNIEQYYKGLQQVRFKEHEMGKGKKGISELVRKFKGTTRDTYLKCNSRDDFENNKYKYAFAVPHLFVYPETGVIKVEKSSIKIVGNKHTVAPGRITLDW